MWIPNVRTDGKYSDHKMSDRKQADIRGFHKLTIFIIANSQ